ncbi:UPF0587 protein v1g245604 [Schistocerca nitens]|uniref:UPF0587 protein v1g245604 n=1 Tax=Schistocerca nitens TaxID=7011 RepID=UPI0021182539|nr:UPF0587 protein v1g245604 [Schistocerca nitens]XP_049807242.1 UPF0587 protein v1g245604 [Schistocerca nitens]
MVRFSVYVKAETENVETLFFNPDEYVWNIMVKCANCKEVYDNWQTLCKSVTKPLRVGRGYVHYSSKCKFCKMENSIIIMEDSMKPYDGNRNDFQPIATFECRGIELMGIRPGGGWIVTTKRNNSTFTDINLDEDYVEYNEEGVLSILDFECQVRRS